MRVMALFSTSFFAKSLCVVEDGPGRGHLCHIDTILDITTMFHRIPVFNANSVDPDQMLHSSVSDLGLHCLQGTLLGSLDQKGFTGYHFPPASVSTVPFWDL